MDIKDAFRKFPLFAGLSEEHLSRLESIGQFKSFDNEQIIFNQGDDPDGLYILIDGTVSVYLTNEDGDPVELAKLSSGDFFGEMALLDGQPRSASIGCLSACQLLLLGRQHFLQLLTSAPVMLECLLTDLSRRVRGTQEKFYFELLERQRTKNEMEIERARSLSQMVAGMAHEINTPLGIVNSSVSLISELINDPALQEDVKSDDAKMALEDIFEAARLMEGNIERASKLIQRFKKLSYHQAAETQEVIDIKEFVDEIVSLFQIQIKASPLEAEFMPAVEGSTEWNGFPGYLSQILLNLLTNAQRYAYPEGEAGKIEVTLSTHAYDNTDGYRIEVRDQGKGIPEDNLAQIFTPFFTTGREIGATGLGLAIVYNLATESLKGRISVESSSEGTEFQVWVPREVPSSAT